MGQTYLLKGLGKAYSRQWAFRQLGSFCQGSGARKTKVTQTLDKVTVGVYP